ncbi:DUF3794 domain-containing protein [Clostridium tarantellae]|uniref:DUF3794 domain-containing protein n=1 Tax=Clostridium tarantellae TaxID=39493 RepID=A0A6I1MHS7_9CLOT|nr:DUF3794 domain-containing protein [Clostridium tarantellae]MPQ42424.1 DUF3794 domain-containing protein [Clostridium tarantellae]
MYCTCSNKNNYEIISLCDIKKFTEKNGPFNANSAWTQISIADIFNLECDKHNIESIEKVYINVSITHTKIIETPKSPNINSEGMTLTGKKLLIDGYVCVKIVYTSLTKVQSIHTVKFNIPFCTYIVIEENADIFNDIYCIESCVEDVFLSLIDCRTIFQNITLFLFAHKETLNCPSPQPPKDNCTIQAGAQPIQAQPFQSQPESSIINESSSIQYSKTPINPITNITANLIEVKNEEDLTILTIELNNNKFITNYTGDITNRTLEDSLYFSLLLEDKNGFVKTYNELKANEIADTFATNLNNISFEDGDKLLLSYIDNNKISIINNIFNTEYKLQDTMEEFIIKNGQLSTN